MTTALRSIPADQVITGRVASSVKTALAVVLLAIPLSGCNDRSTASGERAAFVRTEVVESRDGQAAVTLTGEVQARFSAQLSFRVRGRGEPPERSAALDAATAGCAAAESQLRVAQATFDRQNYLISSGFTTSTAYDQAKEGLRTAQSTLETAKSQLGQAHEALDDTELHARASGVITARNLEIGQVVQSAQSVFTLAQDGERDAVFDVPESSVMGDVRGGPVALSLVSDPDVIAVGKVREVAPVVDPKSLTIRVKVAIQDPPPAMTLGSAVAGTVSTKAAAAITVPWTALMAQGSKTAVWIVDPRTKTASLRPVTIDAYKSGAVLIKSGIQAGDRIVVDGGKLLSSGQPVSYSEERS